MMEWPIAYIHLQMKRECEQRQDVVYGLPYTPEPFSLQLMDAKAEQLWAKVLSYTMISVKSPSYTC